MAGLNPSVTRAFGNSPRNLQQRTEEEAPALADLSDGGLSEGEGRAPASAPTPEDQPVAAKTAGIPAEDPAQVDAEIQAMLQEYMGAEGAPPQEATQTGAAGGEDDLMEPPSGRIDFNLIEQLKEAPTRLKNAFTVTNAESLKVIRESGLFDDAKIINGKLHVKRKGKKGFEPFDKDSFEIVGDLLDWTRDAFEMAVEGGTEALGTAAGFFAGTPMGPGAVATGVAGNIAAGAAGAVTAKNAGDFVAQQLLGIERDPNRSKAFENATAAAFGAGFGWLGSKITRSLAARKAAKDAGEESIAFSAREIRESQQLVEDIKASGIKLTDDGEFVLDANIALGGRDPEARAAAKFVSSEEGYRNFVRQFGDSLVSAYEGVIKRLGSLAGRTSDDLGKGFVLTAKDIRSAEGKLIGSFRRSAQAHFKEAPQTARHTFDEMSKIQQNLMGSDGKILKDKDAVNALIDRYSLKPSAAASLYRTINEVQGHLSRPRPERLAVGRQMFQHGTDPAAVAPRNQMKFKTILDLRERLTGQINSAFKAGDVNKADVLIKLRDALNKDQLELIEQSLGPEQLRQFQRHVGRYKELMDATRDLGNVLKGENISKDVLIQKLFEGPQARSFLQSAKTLIKETNPDLWRELGAGYLDRLMRDSTEEITQVGANGITRSVRNVNWNRMAQKWDKLDGSIKQEITDAAGIGRKGMDALLSLGQKFQNSEVSLLAKEPKEQVIKRLVKGFFQFWKGGGASQGNAAVTALEHLGKDQAVLKYLQQGNNLEAFLRELKGLDPKGFAKGRDIVNAITDKVRNEFSESTLKILDHGVTGTRALPRREFEDKK